ncbi:HigA family addiction module antitoxin [Blautia sp. MSJ-9]|uniref:HigA family addiction module antitoxin n=1 Tax=Blautia sp. MSJ-9 TaxID=2841511 RepID=UPI001C11B89D|nr:HigA family addiction module antitoxin [Blautia sp. MSJ-9]MBU5681281.1 HigA family addiction module antidote protein [Blautia sp. MSJ-9]
MSNVDEYKDIVAFHPGYYIADIIADMEISQAEFATRMGTTAKTLSQLINGQANISNDLAKKLSVMMGTSAEVWLNLQNTYDQKLIEIQQAKDFDAQAELAREIDYKYFVDVIGLSVTRNINEKVSNLCKFFKVADLRIMLQPDFLVNFRASGTCGREKNIINSRAWIQTAINISKNVETKPYDAEKLKGYLPELRGMTIKKPEEFLPRMREIFAECGVAFVLLPHLKNSGVNGAVKWVNEDRVVLAMNNRGLDADKFWFSLFHEIKHVLQQKIKTVFVSSTVEEMIDINNNLEREADKFATNYLIPPAEYKKLAPSKYTSDNEIVEFAKSIGIHPGIVAGRMQHEGIIAQNRCSKLKEKYVIEIKHTA